MFNTHTHDIAVLYALIQQHNHSLNLINNERAEFSSALQQNSQLVDERFASITLDFIANLHAERSVLEDRLSQVVDQHLAYMSKLKSEMTNLVNEVQTTDVSLGLAGARIEGWEVHSSSFWNYILASDPTAILNENFTLGNCWSFQGTHADAIIRLAHAAVITHFAIEHAPDDDVGRAPKTLRLWGLRITSDVRNYIDLGIFSFEFTNEVLVHRFPVEGIEAFKFVKTEMVGNHGAADTCVYRIRLFGRRV